MGPHRAFVGNVPFEATSEDIKNHFSQFGTLVATDMKQGFCFVEYDTKSALLKAIAECNNAEFMGMVLKVERARPLRDFSADKGCYTCGDKTHFAKECPERKKRREGGGLRRYDRDRDSDRRRRPSVSRSRSPSSPYRRSSRRRSRSRSPRRNRDRSRDRNRGEHSTFRDKSRYEKNRDRQDARVNNNSGPDYYGGYSNMGGAQGNQFGQPTYYIPPGSVPPFPSNFAAYPMSEAPYRNAMPPHVPNVSYEYPVNESVNPPISYPYAPPTYSNISYLQPPGQIPGNQTYYPYPQSMYSSMPPSNPISSEYDVGEGRVSSVTAYQPTNTFQSPSGVKYPQLASISSYPSQQNKGFSTEGNIGGYFVDSRASSSAIDTGFSYHPQNDLHGFSGSTNRTTNTYSKIYTSVPTTPNTSPSQ